MIPVVSGAEEEDLAADGVEAHVMVDVPIYGLPAEIPTTDRVRVLIGGISHGLVDNDDESLFALLFDNGAFRLSGWKIEVAKPIEIQGVSNRAVR